MFQTKLKILALFGVLLLFLLTIGCSKDSPILKDPEKIRITYVKSPLNIPSIVEKETAAFEKAFPNSLVSFPEINSGAKQTEAMASGDLDIASALGGTSAILGKANGVDLKVLGIYSRAPKAFTIMTKNSTIQTVKDLKGKKIGGPKGTILHQILVAALAKEGMSIEDVEFISMDIPKALAAMENNSLDAALVAGPGVYLSSQNGARILTTGEGLTNAIIVIAASQDFITKYPETVKTFMKTHQKTLDLMALESAKTLDITAKETGLSPEAVATMASWYDFRSDVTPEDIKDLEETQQFMVDHGMLQKEKIIDIPSLFLK